MNDDSIKKSATVLVPGFGRLTIAQLEKEVASKFKDIAKRAEKGEWKTIMWLLTQNNSTLQAQLQALCDLEDGNYSITIKK